MEIGRASCRENNPVNGIRSATVYLIVQNRSRFVFARYDVAVRIACKHTQLRKTYDLHIGTARRVKGIEQPAELLRHNDDAVAVSAAASRKRNRSLKSPMRNS